MKIFNANKEVVYESPKDALYSQRLNKDSFSRMNLDGAIFDGLCLEASDFWATSLANSSFKNCDLYWADFTEVNLQNANFEGALLRGCDFTQANLFNVNLKNADLGLDNMGHTPAKFQGANLGGAIVDGADFFGAEYDSKTIFPEGFSPEEHGMICDEKPISSNNSSEEKDGRKVQ